VTFDEYLELGRPANNRGELLFQECPSCGDERGHFYYNTEKGVGNCKKCDYSPTRKQLIRALGISLYDERGSLLDVIVDGLDEIQSEDMLANINDALVDQEEEEEALPLIPLPFEAQPAYHAHVAVRYLRKRGLTETDILARELLYCKKGAYAGRVVFPIRNTRGDLAGFTSRGIFSWSSDVKYKTPPGFQISRYLYGEDLLGPRMDTIILVEGPFDQIRAGTGAVATFGKKISTYQLATLLKCNPKTLTLMWDSDAHVDAGKYGALLSNYFPTRVVLLEGGDPGATARRKLLAAIDRTPYYRSFEWSLNALVNKET